MAKDKKSEKKAVVPKVKEVKPASAAKIPTAKEILDKKNKAVSTFKCFKESNLDCRFSNSPNHLLNQPRLRSKGKKCA